MKKFVCVSSDSISRVILPLSEFLNLYTFTDSCAILNDKKSNLHIFPSKIALNENVRKNLVEKFAVNDVSGTFRIFADGCEFEIIKSN